MLNLPNPTVDEVSVLAGPFRCFVNVLKSYNIEMCGRNQGDEDSQIITFSQQGLGMEPWLPTIYINSYS